MEQGIIQYTPSDEDTDVVDMPIGYCQWCKKSFMVVRIPAMEYHCYICKENRSFDPDEYIEFCRTKAKYRSLEYIPHVQTEQDTIQEKVDASKSPECFLECPKCENWKISTNDPVGFLNHVDNCSKS